MRKFPVWALSPGMIVGRSVYDANGFLLLNEGIELKKEYIQSLKRLQIPAIYIVDELIPDIDLEDVILEETRQKARLLMKKILINIKNQPGESIPKLKYFQKDLEYILEDIIGQLLNNRHLTVNLSDIRTSDSYTFAHSVNVAVLAIITAIALDYSFGELKKIALGAILHDLGKTQVPLSILNKNSNLSAEEYKEIRKHPLYGYNLIKPQKFIAPPSAKIIYQHHERLDGSGYPEGLKGDQLHPFSKICAVVDVYDALVSDRPYRSAFPPHEALEILESGGEQFDIVVLQKFYQHIAAYPIGSLVGLSNGEIGIVVHNAVGFPFRPKVRSIGLKEGFQPITPYEINLQQKKDIVVDKVYKEGELPERIFSKNCS